MAVLAATPVCRRVAGVGVAGSAVAVGGHRRAGLMAISFGLSFRSLPEPTKPPCFTALAVRAQMGRRSAGRTVEACGVRADAALRAGAKARVLADSVCAVGIRRAATAGTAMLDRLSRALVAA